MPRSLDLTGQRFGRWLVTGDAGHNRHRQRLWWVVCVCGATAERSTRDLTSGASQSCGCLRAEQLADRNRQRAGRQEPLREARTCDHCGLEYRPRSHKSRYCSRECRSLAGWNRIAGDPIRRRLHSLQVSAEAKAQREIDHGACAHCGRPFRAPPTRLHCSRACLDAVIRAGKYRDRHHRRRVEAEAAALAAELQRRADR